MLCPNCKEQEMVFAGETTGSDSLWCPHCGTITGAIEGEFLVPSLMSGSLLTNEERSWDLFGVLELGELEGEHD